MAYLMTDVAAGGQAALQLQQTMAAAPDVKQAQANVMQEQQLKLQQEQANVERTKLSNIVTQTAIQADTKKQRIVSKWMQDPENANKSEADMASGLSRAFMMNSLVEDGEKLSSTAANLEAKKVATDLKKHESDQQLIADQYAAIKDASPEQIKDIFSKAPDSFKTLLKSRIPGYFEENDPALQKSQLENMLLSAKGEMGLRIAQTKAKAALDIEKSREASSLKRTLAMIAGRETSSGDKEQESIRSHYVSESNRIASTYHKDIVTASRNVKALSVAYEKSGLWGFGKGDAEKNLTSAVEELADLQQAENDQQTALVQGLPDKYPGKVAELSRLRDIADKIEVFRASGGKPTSKREASGKIEDTSKKPSVPSNKGGPAVGTIQDGYKFKGGNPADPKSWEKV